MSSGPNQSDVRLILKVVHPSSPHFWRFNELRNSASASRPRASMSNSWLPTSAAWVSGGPQSVHSRGMANEPNSPWRKLKVSTPETFLTFRTTNRSPRKGWNGWVISAEPKGGRGKSAVRCDRGRTRGQDRPESDGCGAERDLRGRLPRVLVRIPTRAWHARCA
jgi:hypothetical protein